MDCFSNHSLWLILKLSLFSATRICAHLALSVLQQHYSDTLALNLGFLWPWIKLLTCEFLYLVRTCHWCHAADELPDVEYAWLVCQCELNGAAIYHLSVAWSIQTRKKWEIIMLIWSGGVQFSLYSMQHYHHQFYWNLYICKQCTKRFFVFQYFLF